MGSKEIREKVQKILFKIYDDGVQHNDCDLSAKYNEIEVILNKQLQPKEESLEVEEGACYIIRGNKAHNRSDVDKIKIIEVTGVTILLEYTDRNITVRKLREQFFQDWKIEEYATQQSNQVSDEEIDEQIRYFLESNLFKDESVQSVMVRIAKWMRKQLTKKD
jgi:hypothetical protein